MTIPADTTPPPMTIVCPRCGSTNVLVARNTRSTGTCRDCGFMQDDAYRTFIPRKTPVPPPDADDAARLAAELRHASKAWRERPGVNLTHGSIKALADHLDALGATRAALDGTEMMLWVLSEILDRDESALPFRQLVDAKRKQVSAALADATRARGKAEERR